MTTCVANQKLESSTALIISIVSPVGLSDESMLRLCAIIKLPKPINEPIADAIPKRMYFSVPKHNRTAPQPMNSADE